MNEYIPIPIITESLFKQHSPVTLNVEIDEFIPYISIAQELYIEPVLGEPLMAELKDQILNNTVTEANGSLIVKVAPALSFFAVYQGLPFQWASIVNKGITKGKSENSESIDRNDLAQLRRWIKDDAELLVSQLINFLCKCRTNYPLWRPPNTNCCNDVINEGTNEKKFESGFYFPNKNKGCGCS